MNHPDSYPAPFRLNDWLVQPDLNRITGSGSEHRIEPRVMQVLLALAARSGEVLSRSTLLDEVWSDTVVGEEILTRAVSELRRILGDDPRQPRYIETIRQHGYRLIMPPVPVAPPSKDPKFGSEQGAEPPSRTEANTDVGRASEARTRPSRPWRRWGAVLVLVIIGILLGPRLFRTSAPSGGGPDDRPSSAVPLTSFPGRELHPALSTDGGRVAFVWSGPTGEAPGVFVKQRNSETPLRLTDAAGWPAWPAWSPDGQTVAFVQTGDTASTLCVVPSLGGAVEPLFEIRGLVEGLDWSPDGQTLIFAAPADGPGLFRLHEFDLATYSVTIRPPSVLVGSGADDTNELRPCYSPDGRSLAWITLDPAGTAGIVVEGPEGRAPTSPISGLAALQGLAWTADGRSLVYAASPAGKSSLWWIAIDGGTPRWIPTAGEFAWNPTIASETGDLAWEQVRVDVDIWRAQVTGRDPLQWSTRSFLASTRWEYSADFSPDGNRIAFVSARSGRPEVWLVDAQGQEMRQLTSLAAAAVTHLRWSPDGRQLAFNVVRERGSTVMVAPLRGGAPRAIGISERNAVFTAWSRDSAAVLLGADRGQGWQIYRQPLDDGEAVALTTRGGVTAALSSDGRELYHTRPGRPGLWCLTLDLDTEPRIVVEDLRPGDRDNWRILDGWIAWVLRSGRTAFLMRQPLGDGTSGSSGFMTELPGLAGPGLAVAPDGDAILYPRRGTAEGDLMLIPASGI